MECFLLQEISLALLSFIKNIKIVQFEEKSYRSYFVHPVCTAINEYTTPDTTFCPAEAPLNAMNKYLKFYNLIKSDREAYKADGIFEYCGIEFCLNEISGPFRNTDRRKFQFDYHKAIYGCIAMSWNIVQRYHYALLETLEELKIYFIHCKVDSMQLWSLFFDGEKFVMFREKKIIISSDFTNKTKCIYHVMHFSHTCKIKFEETVVALDKLKKQNVNYLNSKLLGQAMKTRKDLRDIVQVRIHKLTESTDATGLFDADPVSFCVDEDETLGPFD